MITLTLRPMPSSMLSLDILIIRSDGVAIIFEVKGFRESVDQALDQILINKYYRILSKEEFRE
jgi:hypothetical protein